MVHFLQEEQQADTEEANMLLIKKALNTRDALRAAAERGAVESVRFLVEEGVTKDDGDSQGLTPLLIAAFNGHYDVVQYLLEQGADKEKPSNIGAVPIHVAAQNGYLDVVQYLLQIGADKDKVTNDGVSPLFMAAHQGPVSAGTRSGQG